MASSKSNKMDRTMYLHALLGLFACAILSLASQGFLANLEENIRGHNDTDNSVQWHTTMARRMQDGFIVLANKFLHFFVARSVQFKYSSPLQPAPFSPSFLFWVAFSRSISSMPDYPLE